jgi:rhodanese-related sulfurtransferase
MMDAMTSPRRDTLDVMLARARRRIRRLQPHEAHRAASVGALIIDIRCSADRDRDGVIPGSVHVPRTVLEWRLTPGSPWRSPYAPDLDREVVVVCDHGYASSLAAASLVDLGFSRAGEVAGGFEAWRHAGLPTMTAIRHDLAAGELVGMRAPEW